MPAHLAPRRVRHRPLGVLSMALGAGLIAYALLGPTGGRQEQRMPLERAATEPTVLGVTVAPDSSYPVADAATPATFGRSGDDSRDADSTTTTSGRSTTSTTDDDEATTTSAPGTTSTTGGTTSTTASTTTTTTEPTTTTTESTTTTST